MFTRAKQILDTEGLQPLFSRGFRFLVGLFFDNNKWYLYESTIRELHEVDFVPKIGNVTYKVVSSNQQAGELAATALQFRSPFVNARKSLDRGAIAVCFFVDGELAHVGWVATNEEAKKCVDALPYHVDFANKQACTGGTWTNPKYRGKGLMTYGYMKRLQFLRENGIKTCRNSVRTDYVASQKVLARFNARIWGKARYLRILCWRCRYKETPVTDNELLGLDR
jgi:RimJ/RimL family protein N-acetyltransferase